MPSLEIPSTHHDITPEWLTEALRSTGAVSDAEVKSVEVELLTAGQGLATQLARLRVEYSAAEKDAPSRLCCKLPVKHAPTLEFARTLGIYEREVSFYQDISDQVPMRTPRPYYSRFDPGTGDFVLILEDLDSGRPGDQVAGCSLQDAELAIRQVATMHAAWWGNPGSTRSTG